jgi:hypothetical protein
MDAGCGLHLFRLRQRRIGKRAEFGLFTAALPRCDRDCEERCGEALARRSQAEGVSGRVQEGTTARSVFERSGYRFAMKKTRQNKKLEPRH